MVLSVLAGGLAAGMGSVLGSIFNKPKNERKDFTTITKTWNVKKTQHAPFENFNYQNTQLYAPQMNIQYPDYSIVLNSPNASAVSSKKQNPSQTEYQTPRQMLYTPDLYSPITRNIPSIHASEGTDFTKIAIIGAIALIGFGLVSRK